MATGKSKIYIFLTKIVWSKLRVERYDRETCVFTPPKHSAMSVYTSSLANHADVLTALLAKYKVDGTHCKT